MKHKKSWIIGHRSEILIATFIIFIFILGFLLSPFLNNNIDKIRTFIENFGAWSAVVFGFIYSVLSIIGVSTVVLTILAGTLFGILLGIIIVVLSATFAGAIAFLLARHFSDRFNISPGKKITNHQKIINLKNKSNREIFSAIVLLRLSFLPYIPLSYGLGFVKEIRFIDFLAATFITNIFGSSVFILFGASLGRSFIYFVIAFLTVVLFLLFLRFIKKKQ